MRASEKCSSTTFMEVDIRYRIACFFLQPCDPELNFKDQKYKIWISRNCKSYRKMLPITFMQVDIRHHCECFSLWSEFSRTNFSIGNFDRYRLKNANYCHLIGSQTFAIVWQMLYIMTLTYIFNVAKFEMWIFGKRRELEKMLKYNFYKGRYFPSNGTIVIVVVHNLDFHFQGQTFSCYAFAIKKCSGSGCPRQICLDSYGPRRGVALVILLHYWYRWLLFCILMTRQACSRRIW